MICPSDRVPKTLYRLIRNRKIWDYSSYGYCSSCDSNTIFIYSKEVHSFILDISRPWDLSQEFKNSLQERENHFCSYCMANFRMRAHADSALKLLGFDRARNLFRRLESDQHFSVYETSFYNIFRHVRLKKVKNYQVSEYFNDASPGEMANNIRHEDLECLTFPDNSFDLVINSDVLEHVAHLDKALAEIIRVLKPGGFHVFTVPVDHELKMTRERAIMANGDIKHLMEPVMHGDTIRKEGILAFRDFGQDILKHVSREGFECGEHKYYKNDRHITSVYFAKKKT